MPGKKPVKELMVGVFEYPHILYLMISFFVIMNRRWTEKTTSTGVYFLLDFFSDSDCILDFFVSQNL